VRDANVAEATHNQTLNALVFFYREVLQKELAGADKRANCKTPSNRAIPGPWKF